MSDETTTEQLAEIEGQAEDTPATEYTPPEGWRVLAVGEVLLEGDERVQTDESRYATRQAGRAVQAHERYIRRIDRKPQPIEVCAGRWRTRGGHYVCVESMSGDDFASIAYGYTWRGCNTPELQWNDNGLREIDSGERGPMDLVEYLGPIEQQPEPVPEPDAELRIRLLKEANDSQAETIGRLQAAIDERAELGGADQTRIELQGRIRELETIRESQAATIEELRSEVSYVQNLLGESRQRVTQLEELVTSLRTINVTQEKAFTAAGQENTALRNQLLAVKTELASVAADRQQLRVELDAAQQVPADSPEIRQLRADLAEVTRERDQYRDAFDRVIADSKTIRETTKAETVEAIVEWLVPVQGAIAAPDNVDESTRAGWFAEEVIQHLPSIMRSLTGLDSPEDVD